MSAAIITTDARATDIVTRRSMRRMTALSFQRDGNQEEEALLTQAHPSDHTTHVDQDARSLGRPHRGEGRA
jgi:hypothetical protein